jgi:hypothetical protein
MNDTTAHTAKSIALFVAMVATGFALGGALSHLYELPNKIGISREHYLIVQRNYDGWWQLAYVLAAQLVGILAALILTRGDAWTRGWLVLALAGLMGAQMVFWVYTYPTNAATSNWTVLPENWQDLRASWEYSHAIGAIFQLVSFTALVIACLSRKEMRRR